MASAFIIEVHSRLQPDPSEETAALLRVLLYKLDNTTFGGNTPTVPEWTGPPYAAVQVQALLYASLGFSFFAAFLAMLGKQWLNRYASADIRGTVIERGLNRQRKLNGIVRWYFHHVMESLPLMLQFALLLLGSALSCFLWEIDPTIASVTISVTSFGVLFYLFILVAGTVSLNFPYQTPVAHVLRIILHHNLSHTLHHILHILQSGLSVIVKHSICCDIISSKWNLLNNQHFPLGQTIMYTMSLLLLPLVAVMDILHLGLAIIKLSLDFALRKLSQPITATEVYGLDLPTELQCVSWMFQSSLNKAVHLLALRFLGLLIMAIPNDNLLLISNSFSILFGYIKVIKKDIKHQPEPLVALSVMDSCISLSELSTIDPASPIFITIRQQYVRVFPTVADLQGSPYHHSVGAIHNMLYPHQDHSWLDWRSCEASESHCLPLAHALAKLASSKYQRQEKVPRWILRFVLHFLSLDPPPATSVITSCFLIIASELGCNAQRPDGRYVNFFSIDVHLFDPESA